MKYGIVVVDGTEKKIMKKGMTFNKALMERNIMLRCYQKKGFRVHNQNDYVSLSKNAHEFGVYLVEQA
jgi:hypothetical protein